MENIIKNVQNIQPRRKSEYIGVYWVKDRKTWRSIMCHNKKRIFLGYNKSEIECARMYDRKCYELFGRHGQFNFCYLDYIILEDSDCE